MNAAPASKARKTERSIRAFFGICRMVFTLLGLAGVSTALAQPSAREYDVKGTLLFNFSQFVEWPAAAVSDTSAPFVIGILGTDPFGKFLDELVKHERAHGKPIVIRRLRKAEQAAQAHILFISKSEQPRIASILPALKGRPILTVSDVGEPGFHRHGGMIALAVERGNIRIRVNLDEARSAGLEISAKLLSLAEVVRREPP